MESPEIQRDGVSHSKLFVTSGQQESLLCVRDRVRDSSVMGMSRVEWESPKIAPQGFT